MIIRRITGNHQESLGITRPSPTTGLGSRGALRCTSWTAVPANFTWRNGVSMIAKLVLTTRTTCLSTYQRLASVARGRAGLRFHRSSRPSRTSTMGFLTLPNSAGLFQGHPQKTRIGLSTRQRMTRCALRRSPIISHQRFSHFGGFLGFLVIMTTVELLDSFSPI